LSTPPPDSAATARSDRADVSPPPDRRRPSWINSTVIGIVGATFLSDFSHEMVTAVLPLYLASVGLGAAALGIIEGIADFLVSLSKLAGGVAGHRPPFANHKRGLASLGYLITAAGTSALALVHSAYAMVTLRSIAWMGRGFRGPLRDFLLSDAVEPTHYGRAYGLERAGDMLGAVAGPLMATLLVFAGLPFRSVILWAFIPGVLAAATFFLLARERRSPGPAVQPVPPTPVPLAPAAVPPAPKAKPRFPRVFWMFLVGAMLFGVGDFSRTFLILLAAASMGETGGGTLSAGHISIAILLYAMHNAISALAAYPIGHLGDRRPKRTVLMGGYALGMATNVLLALFSASAAGVVVAIVLSAVYIAVEETMEKAAAAELLPRELRSLGFGALATANAVGDMASSILVGVLLQAGHGPLAFGIAAAFSGLGFVWMAVFVTRPETTPRTPA
jgi:MFS family permease